LATSTTRLGLTKPDGTDLVDIAVLNTNANKIDAAVGAFVCTSTTRPSTPYAGQIIYETDTDQSFVWDSATSAWNTLTPGATVCTSASRPASPVPGQVIYETDTKLTYVYASGAWAPVVNNKAVSAFSPIRVADGTARDALFTAPVQGDRVFRVDTGVEETYYGLYSNPANLGGRDTAGWYGTSRVDGLVPVRPTSVVVGAGSASVNSLGLITFTNATSVNLNGVFTSAFRNYKIFVELETASAVPSTTFRLRASGTDASAANYSYYGYRAISWSPGVAGSSNTTGWALFDVNTGASVVHMIMDIMLPATTSKTRMVSTGYTNEAAGARIGTSYYSGHHSLSTAYDGLSFINTVAFNGTMQVLGYNS
jgi:hypothetical protein